MVTTQFSEIATDFTDDNGVLHLDGYKTDDIGCVVAYVFNREVYYTNPKYRYDNLVISTVIDLRERGIICSNTVTL